MKDLYLIALAMFILGYIIKLLNKKNKNNITEYKYSILKNPMSETELKFCKLLKKITDDNNLIIIPQIQIQKIFKTYNKNDIKAFNKIKSKSIDFAIVDENYNYKFFIELDDYTHNKKNRIQRDSFVNELFEKNGYKLIRIKVQSFYNMEELESKIKEVV